ncbi:hypothetical protein Pme01_01560 [Planosporangium mesophilum]|uniref:DUF4240 domain-containing protein n=2 Tax=Planosporangium mesophilum TaxID=689768 RepID=A0A8J3T621_9ACTN|nr:hypothetical protein Pme01_01560 [Planosporangium mesophilum]
MEMDSFWDLIERSWRHTADPEERVEWLTGQLTRLPSDEIVAFQVWLERLHQWADSWRMWGAAYQICDGMCSEDGFWGFQSWLIGLGRDAFERVVAHPDALADVPQVRRLAGRGADGWAEHEWPEWESLDYVARRAYAQVTGEEDGFEEALEARGHDSSLSPEPAGERWDFEDTAEVARRFPRLARMFPLSPRVDDRDETDGGCYRQLASER